MPGEQRQRLVSWAIPTHLFDQDCDHTSSRTATAPSIHTSNHQILPSAYSSYSRCRRREDHLPITLIRRPSESIDLALADRHADSDPAMSCSRYLQDFSKALAGEVRILLQEVGKLRDERSQLQAYVVVPRAYTSLSIVYWTAIV